MINKFELRLGNLVNYEQTTHRIISLFHEEHCKSVWINGDNKEDYIHSYEEIKGIPITMDELRKFGFKNSFVKGRCLDSISLWESDEQWLYEINESSANEYGAIAREIKYLHQLQNIYYYLEGKELNYDS